MPTVHYKYGGSTAGRTIQCPAWHELSKRIPVNDTGSEHADRGTLLHDCMEELLVNPDIELESLIGKTYNDQIISEDEITSAIKPALNAYIDFAELHNIALELPELEVKYNEDTGGTSDLIAVNEDTVFILDWKFGFIAVAAHENPQGLFYAMCARKDPNTKDLFKGRNKICIVIIQPTDGAIMSSWDIDSSRLNKFEDEYIKAKRAQNIDAPKTGAYCKFCPAMAICPAKTGLARKAMMMEPTSEDAKGLSEALDLADSVIEWAQSVKKLAHEQAELGLKISGYKLVDKRATRKWKCTAEVETVIKKARRVKIMDAMNATLKSPAQLEKVFKQKGLDFDKYAAYIEAVSTGTTLTTADDKRPEAFNVGAFAAMIKQTD
jgi:hypothetical protein